MASSQIAYAGSDVVVTLNVIDSTGTHQAATGLNASRLSSHPSAVPVVTNPNSEPGVYVLTWSSLSPATSEGDSIVALIEGSVNSTPFSTYAIPLKVVANERGTDNASTFDNAVDTVITDTASRDASKADVSLLATAASISALNDFDPATDQVIVATNNDKTGYSLSTAPPTAAEIYTEFISGSNEDAFKADVTGISAQISALNDLSSTDVENSVWDAAYASHTSAGSFGKLMDILRKANRGIEGTVSGTPTASAFDTDLTGYTTGAFDSETLVFLSGALEGEARPILSYNATNGRITFEEALTAAPTAADEFIILPYHVHPISEIVDGIFNEPQSGYTTAGTFGYYIDSQISSISSGGGDATAANQTTIIGHLSDIKGVTFDDSTDSLEAIRDRGDAAWTTGGGSGIYTLTVTVKDASDNLISGARVNIDSTTNTLTSDSQGQVIFNLDAGSYTLVTSPPSGYQTPANLAVTISSDESSEIILTPTSTTSEAGWLG